MTSVVVKVCMGTHCTMMGNLNLYSDLEELQYNFPDNIILETVKCLGACKGGNTPVVEIDGKIKTSAKSEEIISEILEVIN